MKWAVIGHNPLIARYEILAALLTKHGFANEMRPVECQPDKLDEVLKPLLSEMNQVRVESPLRALVLSHFHMQTKVVAGLDAADCLVQRQGQWWPDACLFYAFTELFSRHGTKLDIKAEVLVVGAGAGARLVVAAALRAGFAHVNISSKFNDEGLHLVSELKTQYFGVKFVFVPQDRLVLLPGTNALVINTTPFAENNDILAELYYLNFLRPDGMIWDLVIDPGTTPLIREGEQISIGCVRGLEIAALADSLWTSWVSPVRVPESELLEAYRAKFTQEPVKSPENEKVGL